MLNDQLVEPELLSRTLQHPLLDTTLGDESEDEHLFCLADAVGTIHCLEIGLWVPVHLSEPKSQRTSASLPVAVIKDDNISTRQVDTQPAGASGKQEDKFVAPLLVVIINGLNTVFVCGATVDPTILWYNVSVGYRWCTMKHTVCSEQAVIFHNVQHSTHLTEYEDARAVDLQGSKQFIQDDHFTAVLNKMHVSGIWGARFLVESLAPVLGTSMTNNAQLLRTGTGDKRLFVVA